MADEGDKVVNWNMGKDFFEILSDIKRLHFQFISMNNYAGAVEKLIDECDFINGDITDKTKLETQRKKLISLRTELSKSTSSRNKKAYYYRKISDARREIWLLENNDGLDHPKGMMILDPSKALLENR